MLIRPPRIRRAFVPACVALATVVTACGGSSGGSGGTGGGGGGGGGNISGGVATAVMPDWNDENDAYAARNLTKGNAQLDIEDGGYREEDLQTFAGLDSISDTHDGTEGDDLWTAYQMYRRLDGIRQPAADRWYERAQNLANFFKNDYVGGTAWDGDENFAHDHLYGWGLCEWVVGENDTSAITTIDQIVSEMDTFFGPNSPDNWETQPGDSLFHVGTGGRRWARQLRFAVCAAEVSPTSDNLAWRDKVIELMLQTDEWDDNYGAYWLGSGPTNNGSRLGSGAYQNDDRITITFHMGIWMDALWHAWLATGRQDVAERLIAMAEFYLDFPLNADGHLELNLGYNMQSGDPVVNGGSGTPTGVYSISPINGLVAAYKLTGEQSFLDRAWTLWENWQASLAGSPGTIHHYVDSEVASATAFQYLANNKGELQYTYQLFEDGGDPDVISWFLARPNWLKNAEQRTWVAVGDNGFMDVDPEKDPAWQDGPFTNPNWDFESGPGPDYHTAVVDNWNGGVARNDYLVIPFAGGHSGSQQNTIYEFGPFTSENPKWNWFGNTGDGAGGSKYDPPTHTGPAVDGEVPVTSWGAQEGEDPYTDGKPASRHTYDHLVYIPELESGVGMLAFAPFGYSLYNDPSIGGSSTEKAAAFQFDSEDDEGGFYVGMGTYKKWPGGNIGPGGGAEWDVGQKRVWATTTSGSKNLYSFDPDANEYEQHNSSSPNHRNDTDGVALDPERRIFVLHAQDSELVVWDIDVADEIGTAPGKDGDFVVISSNYGGPLSNASDIGFEYEPAGKKFVGYNGGSKLFTLEPPDDYRNADGTLNPDAAWTWEEVNNGSGGVTPSAANDRGTYGRFRYIPSIHAFAVFNNSGDSSVHVYKLPPTGL